MQPVSESSVQESLDHLFRHRSGQMVSVLSRIFGFEKLDLIEDAVQDALVSALRNWPYSGYPENRSAWLIQVAKNRVLDRLKSKSSSHEALVDIDVPDDKNDPALFYSSEISEDQLRMIFACCHPAIPPDSRVALTLKVVSGFNVPEIARAFLAKEDSIAKMITRAKQKLRDNNVQLEMPAPSEISARLETVVKVLYLMFNEGYAASEGAELVRKDLCFEAIRLCELLARHPVANTPKINALAALFLFQGARLSSRYDNEGELLLMSEQDRGSWDKPMLVRAMRYLALSAGGDELSDYHLEAEIASVHALADNYEATDWRRILQCYELLQKRKFSPVVELNRIIVMAKLEGDKKALAELEKFREDPQLKNYNLFYTTQGYLLAAIGERAKAAACYRVAISLTANEPVRRFIQKKIAELSTEISEDR